MNKTTYIALFVLLSLIIVLIILFYGIIFKNLTKCSEAKSHASPVITDIDLLIKNIEGTLPISQYNVFSSWNTACSGKFVSIQQILNVLSTGCRMVDFPITKIKNEPMICSYSLNNEVSGNYIPLSTAVKTCVDNAFQNYITINYNSATCSDYESISKTYTLQNHEDPLFIQLRFGNYILDKYDVQNFLNNDKNNPLQIDVKYLNTIAEKIGYAIKGIQYKNASSTYKLEPNTNLQDLKQKVILLVDVTAIPNDMFEKSELSSITNIVVGNKSGMSMFPFRILLDSVPKNTPHNPIDTNTFNMAIPDSQFFIEPTIKQVMELAVYHNVQFTPFLFYKNNDLLKDYIHFYQEKKSAFLPINHLNDLLIQDSEKAIMG